MGTTQSAQDHAGSGAATEPVPPLDVLLAELKHGVAASDKRYYMRTYRNVMVGSEVVDWLEARPYCSGRAHAVTLGQRLVDAGFIHHVTHEHPFKDEDLFYRLRPLAPDTEATELNAVERRAVEYDLIVIGGGAAGLTAASTAGKLGARVALIEKARLGGDCTWSGCVPSKTLLSIAKRVHTVRQAMEGGVAGSRGHGVFEPLPDGLTLDGSLSVDMRAVRRKIQSVISHIYAEEDPAAISRKGVDVIIGEAAFAPSPGAALTKVGAASPAAAVPADAPATLSTAAIALDVTFRFGVDSVFPGIPFRPDCSKAAGLRVSALPTAESCPASSLAAGTDGDDDSRPRGHGRVAATARKASVEELAAAAGAAASAEAEAVAAGAGPAVAAVAGASARSMAIATLASPPGGISKPVPVLVSKQSNVTGPAEGSTDEARAAATSTEVVASVTSVRRITAANVIIATGATPLPPTLRGLDAVPFFTYESIWANERLPTRLVVVGAGPIGCELAQAYSYLGADVTLVGSKLLAKEDEAAREVMGRVFEREGLKFIQGRPSAVARGAAFTVGVPDIRLMVGETELQCDMLLLATGRIAHTSSLALEHAGIAVGANGGLVVDEKLQTSRARVFGAGDCIDGGQQFTHLAGKQGFVAARNALFWGLSSGDPVALPRCTFTSPEVASVGLTSEQALAKYGDGVKIHLKWNSRIDRALADDDVDGFVSISVLKETGKLVGATAVGSRAGEIIAEAALVITHGLKVSDVALTVHPYPVHVFGFQQVCAEVASELFRNTTVGSIVNGFYRNSRKNRADGSASA